MLPLLPASCSRGEELTSRDMRKGEGVPSQSSAWGEGSTTMASPGEGLPVAAVQEEGSPAAPRTWEGAHWPHERWKAIHVFSMFH